MNFNKAEKYITDLLKAELAAEVHYHDYSHTMDVVNAAIKLAQEENIKNEPDLLLLKTAALFHDCGFIRVYKNHEDEGCVIAKESLPEFGYSQNQIEIICNMIMATKFPQDPQTHLEKILCDADLDYLGREDFEQIGSKLFSEWLEIGKVNTENEWNELQIKFLEEHHYWTQSAISKRENKKMEHLQKLKSLMQKTKTEK